MNGPKITCYQCDIEIPEKLFPRHVKRVHEREDTNKGIFLDQVFEHFWTYFEKTKTLLESDPKKTAQTFWIPESIRTKKQQIWHNQQIADTCPIPKWCRTCM